MVSYGVPKCSHLKGLEWLINIGRRVELIHNHGNCPAILSCVDTARDISGKKGSVQHMTQITILTRTIIQAIRQQKKLLLLNPDPYIEEKEKNKT
jgi:hypothetical protein